MDLRGRRLRPAKAPQARRASRGGRWDRRGGARLDEGPPQRRPRVSGPTRHGGGGPPRTRARRDLVLGGAHRLRAKALAGDPWVGVTCPSASWYAVAMAKAGVAVIGGGKWGVGLAAAAARLGG